MSSAIIDRVNNARIQVIKQIGQLYRNEYTLRQNILSRGMDSRRSINHECGYPETSGISVDEVYSELYGREGIATRVVDIYPDECWAVHPTLFETDDSQEETEFEKAVAGLSDSLRDVESWHMDRDEKGSTFWEVLHRADRLCGIGSYGIVLLQFDDKKQPSQPLEKGSATKLLGMRVIDQSLVQVTEYEQDPTSRRYGKPTIYSVSFSDSDTMSGEIGTPLATVSVHWTRIIHIADNLRSNDDFGVPRMQPVLNRLLDIRKLLSGSAEMYWKGAFPGISFESHPNVDPSDIDAEVKAAFKSEIEQMRNGLQRDMITGGMTANSLAPQVVSPVDQIDAQIDAICIKLGVPKRIFLGSERGELASSQDSRAWNRRVAFRQNNFCTTKIIVPLVDRLIWAGVLPEPAEGYQVEWPDLDQLTPEEKASVAAIRVKAMETFSNAGLAESLMTAFDFLVRELDYNANEAEAILLAVADSLAEVKPAADKQSDVVDDRSGQQ